MGRDALAIPGCVRGVPEGARTVRARRASSAAPEGMPRASPADLCAWAGRQKPAGENRGGLFGCRSGWAGNRGPSPIPLYSSMESKTLSPGALLVAPTRREQSVENRWLLGNREATTVAGDVRGIREGARTVRAERSEGAHLRTLRRAPHSGAAPEGIPRASPADSCARARRQNARRTHGANPSFCPNDRAPSPSDTPAAPQTASARSRTPAPTRCWPPPAPTSATCRPARSPATAARRWLWSR